MSSFQFKADGFAEVELDKNHRTDSPGILSLFRAAREVVYPGTVAGSERPIHVQTAIRTLGDALIGDVQESDIDDGDLVL